MRAPKVAWFYSAAWPDFTPPLTIKVFPSDFSHTEALDVFLQLKSPLSCIITSHQTFK